MKAAVLIFLLALLQGSLAREIRRPRDGDHCLRVLDLATLELEIVTRKRKGEAMPFWDAVDDQGVARLADPGAFKILINGAAAPTAAVRVGFKRRPLYATLGEHDLRVGTQIFLILAAPLELEDGDVVSVIPPDGFRSPPQMTFETRFTTRRHSPAIHINQIGYQIAYPKQALAGYYLGDAGELALGPVQNFHLRDAGTGETVFTAAVERLRESGQPMAKAQYQQVLRCDFSAFDKPGRYVLGIDTLGESAPFVIGDGLFACIARSYALGLYHQRSGTDLALPFSRFTHAASHTAPVRIPGPGNKAAGRLVDGMADQPHDEQQAPELKGYASSLYPIEKQGSLAANGGHHDAGDYSKYTTNCAQLIHHLMFAHDALPGVKEIDNLGLPESGDGLGDLMQIALHEARFLAQLQDDDGGFFFLVYPEDRKYEDDVPPQGAGGQIVFPKNTAATAAAAAALAQIGGSPDLRVHDAAAAARFLQQAERGWEFLEDAWETHGRDGAYQRISHYGDLFMDRDEIVWAATELFLATKKKKYHEFLLANYRPAADETRRWGWQRLFECYGAACRSYAYAKLSGRATEGELDPAHFRACQRELQDWGKRLARYTDESVYGLSFPSESKAIMAAGWYFPASDTLDLVAATAQSDSREFDAAMLSNFNYELGSNPTNTCFLSGLGTKRLFEIVHQWARNDEFQLPMSGIPSGSLVSGLPWLDTYGQELGSTVYPPAGHPEAPYAIYDRVTDTFNVATEPVTYQLGRALAASAYLMARTPLATQSYTHLAATITGAPASAAQGDAIELAIELHQPDPKLGDAVVVWEARGLVNPQIGETLKFNAVSPGPSWATVEAQWPDGRRAFARVDFEVDASNATAPTQPEPAGGHALPTRN